jgi:hypothetical protein
MFWRNILLPSSLKSLKMEPICCSKIIIGLQRAINCIKDFCEEWSLKINVTKTKIVVFKKEGKLSRDEKWRLGGEEIEVVKEIQYLGVVLDSRGTWDKERKQVEIRGKSALNSINICVVELQTSRLKF